MINVKFFHSQNGAPLGFSFKGHAGYAAHGSDIVCAAISSVAYMTANTILEIMKVDADVDVKEDGEMTLKVPEESAEKTVWTSCSKHDENRCERTGRLLRSRC